MAAWASEWKAAKTAFEAKTGQKKPSAASMTAIRKGSGLEDALRTCDTDFAAVEAANDAARKAVAVRKFTADIKVFDARVATYEKVLIASIAEADSKLLQPELTALWKQLYALSASMKSQMGKATAAAQSSRGDEIVAGKLCVALTGSVAKARDFAVKVTKAQGPSSPQIFNAGIVQASMQISVIAGHIEKLLAKGYTFPQGDPRNLFKVIAPWAQNKRKLAATAAPDLVKREIGAFLQAVVGERRSPGQAESMSYVAGLLLGPIVENRFANLLSV